MEGKFRKNISSLRFCPLLDIIRHLSSPQMCVFGKAFENVLIFLKGFFFFLKQLKKDVIFQEIQNELTDWTQMKDEAIIHLLLFSSLPEEELIKANINTPSTFLHLSSHTNMPFLQKTREGPVEAPWPLTYLCES